VFASTAAYYMIGSTLIQTLLHQIKVFKTTSNETVKVVFIICILVVPQLLSAPKRIGFLSYFTFITVILALGVAAVSLLISFVRVINSYSDHLEFLHWIIYMSVAILGYSSFGNYVQ
jgi:hypothetical protein